MGPVAIVITLLLTVPVIAANAVDKRQPASSDAGTEELRERALQVLTKELKGSPIQAMHAAEVLVWNGYTRQVRPLYEAALSSEDAKTRSCAWRVLAQAPDIAAAQRQAYVLKMRDFALDTAGPNADFALESLAKLGYAGRDKPFVEQARSGIPVMRILARWVLANSGKPADEAYLAELLDLPDERMRAVTVYALRFMKHLQPATLAHIEQRLSQEPAAAPDRFFYPVTLYLKGPASQREARKSEMFHYAETADQEGKYQCLLMLGRWADPSDLTHLAPYLGAEDADMRIGAANSILTVLGRERAHGR